MSHQRDAKCNHLPECQKNYKIFQPFDDPNYVIIDLEFDNLKDAENTLIALQKLWTKVEGKVMTNPQTRILCLVETVDL